MTHRLQKNRPPTRMMTWNLNASLKASRTQRTTSKTLFPFYNTKDGGKLGASDFNLRVTLQILLGIGAIGVYFVALGHYTAVQPSAFPTPRPTRGSTEIGLFDEDPALYTLTPSPSPTGYRQPTLQVVQRTVGGSLPTDQTPSLGDNPSGGVSVPTDVYIYMSPTPAGERFAIQLFSYYPAADPDYCLTYDFKAKDCLSLTTSGRDWRDFDQRAFACPVQWLGYELQIPSIGRFPCLDTGEQLTCEGDLCRVAWLDSGLVHTQSHFEGFLYRVTAPPKH